MDRKTNFRLIVYSDSYTNTENLAKILVDFAIVDVTEIVENK